MGEIPYGIVNGQRIANVPTATRFVCTVRRPVQRCGKSWSLVTRPDWFFRKHLRVAGDQGIGIRFFKALQPD